MELFFFCFGEESSLANAEKKIRRFMDAYSLGLVWRGGEMNRVLLVKFRFVLKLYGTYCLVHERYQKAR